MGRTVRFQRTDSEKPLKLVAHSPTLYDPSKTRKQPDSINTLDVSLPMYKQDTRSLDLAKLEYTTGEFQKRMQNIQVGGQSLIDVFGIEPHASGWLEPQNYGIPTDISYANYVPWDSIQPIYMSEDQILKDVIAHTQVPGIRNHHPAVAQVVFQSLEEIPELSHAYLQS